MLSKELILEVLKENIKLEKEIEELKNDTKDICGIHEYYDEKIKELERQLNLQSRYRLDHRNDIDELKKVIKKILETEENQNLINSSLLKLITGNNKETINSELFPDIEASNFEKEQIENRKKCNHESIHLITTGLVMCASCETLSNAPNGDIYKKWVIKNREGKK